MDPAEPRVNSPEIKYGRNFKNKCHRIPFNNFNAKPSVVE